VDAGDVPRELREPSPSAHRRLRVDGEELDLSDGFSELHSRVYADILAGKGLGLADARPAIELAHRIRQTELARPPGAGPARVTTSG
jgi:UDP-N-acetyl-2-amino-2-deoxyglucuronate dehydrogenase